jgi:hypothetical protein
VVLNRLIELRTIHGHAQGDDMNDKKGTYFYAVLTPDTLGTEAAKEWLELRAINEKMMIASGHRD